MLLIRLASLFSHWLAMLLIWSGRDSIWWCICTPTRLREIVPRPDQVEMLLKKRGDYRPHQDFGVNLSIPWNAGSREDQFISSASGVATGRVASWLQL